MNYPHNFHDVLFVFLVMFYEFYHGGFTIKPPFGIVFFYFLFVDLVIFYGFYNGKSPLDHHFGEYVLFVSNHLKQIHDDC